MLKFNQLDLLRGYAAFGVVLYHFMYHFFNVFNINGGFKFFAIGKFGVALFFILSGFLISFSMNRNSPTRFLIFRAIRLLPTLFFCCIISFVFIQLLEINYREVTKFDFMLNFFIFPSWFKAKFIDGSYWTLEYEWVFYLICAFSLFMQKYRFEFISIFLLVLPIIELLGVEYLPVSLYLKDYSLLFLIGVCLSQIYNSDNFFNKYSFILSVAFIIIFLTEKYFYVYMLLSLMFFMAVHNNLGFLDNSLARFMSKISYPLYLLHQTIGFILIVFLELIGFNYYFSIFISFIFVVLLSVIVHSLVEVRLTPILKKAVIRRQLTWPDRGN
jgi:peptidoglycan/LPS O-acetylase OafA/YrhL